MVRLLLLATFCFRVRAEWGGCVDPSESDPPLVTAGLPTPLCLVVSGAGSWVKNEGFTYKRLMFTPIADKYTSFVVEGSYKNRDSYGLGDQIYVHVASNKKLSLQRLYTDESERKVFPFLTAIVSVEKGEVKGVSWDDSYIYCREDRRSENTYKYNGEEFERTDLNTGGCYYTSDVCANSPSECDLKVYVVWSGTDALGRTLNSYHSRLSAFPPATILGRVKKITEALSDAVNSVVDIVDNVIG